MAFNGARLNPSEQPWDTTNYTHPSDPNLQELHRALAYSDGVRPHVRVGLTSTYEMNVVRNLIAGQYAESKNGFVSGVAGNTEVSIWKPNSLYPWSSWTVAQKLYIISTSASDVGQVLLLDGLDSSYNRIFENVTTNGTTAVATTQNFLRLNRVSIITGSGNVGVITERLVSGTGTIVGQMDPGEARNKGGYVTIPTGYTAYLTQMSATQFRGGAGAIGGVLKMYSRLGSGPFILQVIAEVVNGQWEQLLTFPLTCPATMDIDFRFVADGNDTQVSCFYQLLYIANP